MKRLEGKSAVVTGAASGIGRASSILFAQHVASVVCADPSAEVEATAAAIRNAGGRAIALIKGASNEHDVAEMMQTAVKQHGGQGGGSEHDASSCICTSHWLVDAGKEPAGG